MEAGQTVRVPVGLGKHIIEAVTPDELDHWRGIAEVTKPQQEMVAMDLGSVRGKRLQAAADVERQRQEQAIERRRQVEAQRPVWPDPSTNLVWATLDNGNDVNWNEADNYCRALNLGGYSDWRLPEIGELMTIYDPNANLNGNRIKGEIIVGRPWVWSATRGGAGAWYLYLPGGGHDTLDLDHRENWRALCVRGYEHWQDPVTGLIWAKRASRFIVGGGSYGGCGGTWDDANRFCTDLRVGGYSDWRLPTVDELEGMSDATQNIQNNHVKGGISFCGYAWSSTPGSDPSLVWAVEFNYVPAKRQEAQKVWEFGQALCVRR
jgi:hypothetical protein